MAPLRLNLLIDVKNNKVVFAESEKEFVDILLSFLTLPFGKIIQLLNKQSSVGSIDNIYNSVENLDTKYFNAEACKTMLLEPRSSAERLCEDLLIRVDNSNPRRRYKCPSFDCYTKKTKSFSMVAGVKCSCGQTMNVDVFWAKEEMKKEIFLKEATYMISDELHVFPASISNVVPFYQRLGINNFNALEKQVVEVNRDEMLILFKMLLLSKTPLTDAFLKKQCSHIEKETNPANLSHIKLENDKEDQDKTVILKLMCDKSTKRVLYAEADHVMVDTLFSFLAFPLGSMVKLLNKTSFLGCVDNLYNSIDNLAFVSETSKNTLLSPCLFWHYDCSHPLIKIEAPKKPFRTAKAFGCKSCRDIGSKICEHNISKVMTNEINPKMPNLVTDSGGGYAKASFKFMISDEMVITPFSVISATDVLKDLEASVFNLTLQEISIGEAEVLSLLKACLTSSNALNSVFSKVINVFMRKQGRCSLRTSKNVIKGI